MDSNINAYKILKYMKVLVPIVGIGIILTSVIFAITITTLVKVNKEFDRIQDNGIITTISSTTTTVQTNPTTTTVNPTTTVQTNPTTTTVNLTTTNQPSPNATLATYIRTEDVMHHLNELQRIATAENATRAINTPGFNQTLDYIYNSLSSNTNYNITQTFFPVRQFATVRNPILISSINGTIQNHTYSTNLSVAEFYIAQFSTSTNFSDYVELTVIPDVGCEDADWLAANPSPFGRVALVKRGNCTFVAKALLASQYNVAALLIYNDGTSPANVPPININLGETNELPALFLSYTLGQQLADAAQNSAANISVIIDIAVNDLPIPVGNICADTPTGDVTQTIVIGSHSDSVPLDQVSMIMVSHSSEYSIHLYVISGSGSAANLELAIALARLFQTSTYAKYKYRVRFCWWGAEEVGLLGSIYHVKEAKNSTVVGERHSDYLINLNYDMLGSPNFMFGIYDGRTARNDTPVTALPGSNRITALFRDWFDQQNLPWDYTDFSGRSDYGPFLAEGIVAGGLFSGADDIKTQEQRDRYDQILGQGMGGIAGAIHDPCYHRACDSIQNINVFAYEKMVQAAAYVLEYLARQDNLKEWLYPNGTVTRIDTQEQQQEYNSINEYFGLPYF